MLLGLIVTLEPPYIYVYRYFGHHRTRLSTRSILLLNRYVNQTYILCVLILLTDCGILNCALIFLHFTRLNTITKKVWLHLVPQFYYYLVSKATQKQFGFTKIYAYEFIPTQSSYSFTCSSVHSFI